MQDPAELLLKAVVVLAGVIGALWGSYLALQKTKENAIQALRDEHEKNTKSLLKQISTSCTVHRESLKVERLQQKEEIERTVDHYERYIKTLKRIAKLPINGKADLIFKEETDRIRKEIDRKNGKI